MRALSPGLPIAPRGERNQLLRGSEGNVDRVRNARCGVERVVPRLDRDARVTEEVGVVGDRWRGPVACEGDHVVVDIEDMAARIRVVRSGRPDVRSGNVEANMAGSRAPGTAAADAVAAAGQLGIAGDRPIGSAIKLDPAPEAAEVVPGSASVGPPTRQPPPRAPS